jgi:hypothetical protein
MVCKFEWVALEASPLALVNEFQKLSFGNKLDQENQELKNGDFSLKNIDCYIFKIRITFKNIPENLRKSLLFPLFFGVNIV